MVSFLKSHPVAVAAVLLVVGMGAIQVIPAYDTWEMAGLRAVLAVVVMAAMVAIGGWVTVRPSGNGMGFAFRKGLLVLVLAAILFVGALASYLLEDGATLVPGWGGALAGSAVLYLCVGLFEEGLFRGITMNALLAKMGGTRGGVMWALVLSSLVFGLVHVLPYLFFGYVTDLSGVVQFLLKTIETAMLGFFFAAVYLRTRNFWAVALIHGLNDFLIDAPSVLFSASDAVSYVVTDVSEGLASIVVYLAFIVLYLPAVISAVRMVNHCELPCLGIWKESWQPQDPRA